MKLRNLFLILVLVAFALPSFAVSDKDMEQAKVTAAKLYLRWANNGSGYLDDVNASSMADLESKLKSQEKENLKAFNSVKIPSDYASWDKERFVQFWGTTFFTSPALSADGKRAKDRVKAKVSAMNVAAPSAQKEESAKETAADAKKEEKKEDQKPSATSEEAISIPEPTEVTHTEEAIADSLQMIQAEEESMAMPQNQKKAKSHTWIYVVILVVLVILVVWLMVYAANMMKKQGASLDSSDKTSAADNAAFRKEKAALENMIEKLRAENANLRSQLETAKAEITKKASRPTESQKKAVEPVLAKEESRPQPKVINEIFLGRANPKGLFVRGDRRPNPDHTVFVLNTKDGLVGTFRFVETPEAFALATSNPLSFLAGGCICENFEDAETATRIVTDNPGTAVLENGCWKVLRKSKIRFE